MYLFHVLCSLLCVTSVLTSVTEKEKSDPEIESANNSTSAVAKSVPKTQLQNASENSTKNNYSTETTKKLNDNSLNKSVLEGGGKVDYAAAPLPIVKPNSPTMTQETLSSVTRSTTKEDVQKEQTKGIQKEREAKVSARKEVYLPAEQVRINIKARKGVGNETTSSEAESPLENTKLNNNSKTDPVQPAISEQTDKEISTSKLESQSNTTGKNVSSVTEVPHKISTEKVRKHKPKPTVTISGSNVDQPIPASPTKSPPLGMPRKIDYIVPVMITMFALPLLGVATYILYRRGRDCWDKRHYRRMDFLIDGMYNE